MKLLNDIDKLNTKLIDLNNQIKETVDLSVLNKLNKSITSIKDEIAYLNHEFISSIIQRTPEITKNRPYKNN